MLKNQIQNVSKCISHKNRTYALIPTMYKLYKQDCIQINILIRSVGLGLGLDQDRDQGRTECQPTTRVNMRNRVNLSVS